jgi:hypothetical protein
LQAAYWRKQFSALTAQAEKVPALSTKVVADAGRTAQGSSDEHVAQGELNDLRRDEIRHGPVLI